MSVALVRHFGASWPVKRTSERPPSAPEVTYHDLRSPGLLVAGVSFQVYGRALVSAQVDSVRYSEVARGITITQGNALPSDYRLIDAIEPRVGAEAMVFARNGWQLHLRAGFHSRSSGTLAYRGPDPVELATWPGGKRTVQRTIGTTIIARTLWLDVAAAFGGGRNEMRAGLRVPF